MNINVKSKKFEVTDGLRDSVEESFGRIERYFPGKLELTVTLEVIKKYHKAEATVFLDGKILRAEETSDDMYKTIDLVVDKLEKQILKLKDFTNRGKHHSSIRYAVPETYVVDSNNYDEEPTVTRIKKFDLKPMCDEEALLQMDLLGHDFFVYRHDIEDKVKVIYRRKNGDYGIIESV